MVVVVESDQSQNGVVKRSSRFFFCLCWKKSEGNGEEGSLILWGERREKEERESVFLFVWVRSNMIFLF